MQALESSRRNFIKAGLAAIGALSAGGVTAQGKVNHKFDKIVDVIVVGSGTQQLTAVLSPWPVLPFKRKKASKILLNQCFRT